MKFYSTALFASALALLCHSASAGEKVTTFEVTDKGQIEPALVEHLKSKFESLAQVNGAGRRNLAGIPEGYDGRNNFYDTMAWLEYEGIIDEAKRSIIEAGMEEIPGLDKKLPNYPIEPKKRGNKKQPKMYAGQPVGRRENGENGENDRRVLYPGERMVNRKVDYWTDPETQAEYVNDNAEYVSNLMGWLAWQGIISEEDRDNIRADVATRQREVNAQLNANQGSGRRTLYPGERMVNRKVDYWTDSEVQGSYLNNKADRATNTIGWLAWEGIINEDTRDNIQAAIAERQDEINVSLDQSSKIYAGQPVGRREKNPTKMYAGQPVGRRENGGNGENDRRVLYPGERMVNRKVDYWTDPETQAEYVNDNAEYVSNLMGWLAWQGIISEEDRDNIRADVATRQREVNAQLNANQGGRKLGYQDKVAYWSNEENLEKYKAKGIDHAVENGYMANENGEMENEPTYQTVNDDMIGNPDLHYTYVGKGIAHAVNGLEKGVIYSASGIGNAVEGSVDRTTTNVEKTNEAWANQVEKKKKGLRGK